MQLWKKEGCISIYQGESSTQPNYCGLVMFVRGRNKSANYTGDCRLSQADDVYTQEINGGLSTNEHVLIAPHHGGDCGPKHRHYSTPCDIIAISVGTNNSYGHPNGDMLKYLRSLGNVKQTDAGGGVDITETL
jgi:competence protein ComEC